MFDIFYIGTGKTCAVLFLYRRDSTSYKYHTTIYTGKNKKPKNIYANSSNEFKKKIALAKAKVAENKSQTEDGIFSTWAEKWMETQRIPKLEEHQIKQQTLDANKACLNHLNKEFGNRKISSITHSEMQQFINRIAKKNPNTKKPTSHKTIKDILTVWDNVIHMAELNNIEIPKFKKKDIENIGKSADKREAITLEEQNMIIETKHRAQLPAMIMLFAGLRKSEVGALKWELIDFKNNIIDIKQSVLFEKSGRSVKLDGKTYNAKRQIPMCPILRDFLLTYKKEHHCKKGFLVVNQNGEILSKTSWRSLWNSYFDDLNIKYGYEGKLPKWRNKKYPMKIRRFTPHWLRHTFATILFLEKFNVMDSKAILGHADIKTTSNVYTDMRNFNIYSLEEEYKRRLKNEYKVPDGFEK